MRNFVQVMIGAFLKKYKPWNFCLKLASVLLMMALAFNIGGYWLVYHAKVENIQEQVEEKIKRNDYDQSTTRIAIPEDHHLDRSTFRKVHETEFWYKGKLYDVVESKVTSDSIIYHAYHDYAEEQIHQGLQALLQEYQQSEKPKSNTQELQLTIKNWFHHAFDFNLSTAYQALRRLARKIQYEEPSLLQSNPPPVI